MKNFPTMIPVVAVALIDPRARILLQKRRLSGAHGGLWEFPGGKVEYGETLEASLSREIEEELGVRLDLSAIEPLTFASRPGDAHVILLYTCNRWQGEPVCLEGEEIGWFAAEKLPGLSMPPLDVPLARAVMKLLEDRI